MSTWWVVLASAFVMGVIGHLTGRELATGGYRIEEDEAEHDPGNPWWTGPATGLLAGVAAWSVQDLGGWTALPPFLLFAWLTVALVWIDLDVHRLPIGLVVPTGGALLVLVALAVIATGGPRWQGTVIGIALMGGFENDRLQSGQGIALHRYVLHACRHAACRRLSDRTRKASTSS